jgi:hypothetical protein
LAEVISCDCWPAGRLWDQLLHDSRRLCGPTVTACEGRAAFRDGIVNLVRDAVSSDRPLACQWQPPTHYSVPEVGGQASNSMSSTAVIVDCVYNCQYATRTELWSHTLMAYSVTMRVPMRCSHGKGRALRPEDCAHRRHKSPRHGLGTSRGAVLYSAIWFLYLTPATALGCCRLSLLCVTPASDGNTGSVSS